MVCTLLVGQTVWGVRAVAASPLESEATWAIPSDEELIGQFRRTLDQMGFSAQTVQSMAIALQDAIATDNGDPLAAWVGSLTPEFPVVDSLLSSTVQTPTEAARSLDPDSPVYQRIESLPEPIRMSVRTWVARELVRGRLFDEALSVIAEVDPTQTADPATVLFYRGACYHALLMKSEALSDLRRLLERKDEIPRRYARTAELMIADLKPLEEDSLDEVSRLMTDVTRRLDLGRTGDRVAEKEQLIIDKLSKMIEELEKQQQQQQQAAGAGQGGGGGLESGNPAQDSQAGDASGPGDVDRKSLGAADGWGNLPPAERKEALQNLSQDLPTHYRDAIEAYFRKLAKSSE